MIPRKEDDDNGGTLYFSIFVRHKKKTKHMNFEKNLLVRKYPNCEWLFILTT